ncbi:MAG: hypothetical protein KGJ23_02665 [Euryarchaeota archaeon]|nr:hypothetical protein [Euryarchaeota archaeon]MDE1835500.1 hypothetical protein [Euryarchaeota archaeon]MDE1880393.1 hypothetical protein [Euryarchaeota archaeon]MDE2045781.1 hypothetical protein [Thermoplasmata archaeon]
MFIDAYTLALLGLIGTWILVIGTLAIMYWQTRQNRVLNSANAVMTLRERFDSDRMRAARRHLSQKLLQGAHEDITSVEVLTFFELVGALTRRCLLDEELVWEAFGTWISTYWLAIRRPVDMVSQIRTKLKDPLVFHEFEWLFHRVEAIDQKMMGTEHAASVEQVKETDGFLRREAVLLESWGPDDTRPPDLKPAG